MRFDTRPDAPPGSCATPLDVMQGSPEWHALRRRLVTSTQIVDALGEGYDGASIATVRAYRAGEAVRDESWALVRGLACERPLRRYWGRKEGIDTQPGGVYEAHGLMASLDGWANGYPLETKVRDSARWQHYRDGEVRPSERTQCEVQALVTGAPYVILVVAIGVDEPITRYIPHPEGERLDRILGARDAILAADADPSTMMGWLLRVEDWQTYRDMGGRPGEVREIRDVYGTQLAETAALLKSARSEVAAFERTREVISCEISLAAGGEGRVKSGDRILAPKYTRGKLTCWEVER